MVFACFFVILGFKAPDVLLMADIFRVVINNELCGL